MHSFQLLQQGASLAGSVIHAANDTAPLVLQGIQEFTDQLPLITGFASAYAGEKPSGNIDDY